jgi:hypothetical protein
MRRGEPDAFLGGGPSVVDQTQIAFDEGLDARSPEAGVLRP